MPELRDYLERSRGRLGNFSHLIDKCRGKVAQEFRALADVDNSVGFETHEPGARGVGSDGIVRQHDLSQWTSSAVEWAVPLHCHNAVGDNEVDRDGRAHIKNAFLNALPVENVLWPAVPRARYDAEHVFHTQRNAGPVMSFDFWHRDQKVRLQHCARKPKAPHSHEARAQLSANQFVAIEIDKTDILIAKRLSITALQQHQFRVPLVSWALRDNHTFSAHASKEFGCSEHQCRVSVDCIARNVVDQIGLEHDCLALNVDRKEPKTRGEYLINALGISLDVENRNA